MENIGRNLSPVNRTVVTLLLGLVMAVAASTAGTAPKESTKSGSPDNAAGPSDRPATMDRTVLVFIVAGQSNAVGYNHSREYRQGQADFPESLREQSQILFWPGSNARQDLRNTWTTLQLGASALASNEPYAGGCFGPEIGFAHDLAQAMPGRALAIVKFAEGATGIARSEDYSDYIPALAGFDDKGCNWHPPSDDREAGQLYTSLIANVRNALAQLQRREKECVLGGFLWMQGEHEAGISRKMAEDYGDLLASFKQAVRADLEAPALPFVVGEINSHTWAFGDIARKRQKSACLQDPNAILVPTRDLSRNGIGDAAHFDADGMLTLGSRFAEAFLQLQARAKESEENSGCN